MATIAIGYDNRVDDSDTTLTSSTEVTGFEKENVQAVQTSERFRTSVDNPGWIKAAWTKSKQIDLVAVLASTATPWRNVMVNGGDLSSWTATNCTVTDGGVVATGTNMIVDGLNLVDNTSAGGHYVEQAFQIPTPIRGGLAFWVTVRDQGDQAKFRLYINGANTGTVTADFTSETGALLASSGPDATSGTAITNAAAASTYLCGMTFTPDVADTTLTARIYNLNDAGSASYTGATAAGPDIGAVQVEQVNSTATVTTSGYYPATSVQGSYYKVTGTGGGINLSYMAFPLEGNLSDRGVIDTYHLYSARQVDSSVRVDIYDEDNPAAAIDVGRLYAGTAWQPSRQTFVDIAEVAGGGPYREWTIDLGQQITEAERFGELDELRRVLRVVPRGRLQETPSGQLIAQDGARPVLIILDPDETVHPQAQMIHGWVVGLTSGRAGPVNISGTLTEAFGVTITVVEMLP